MAPLPSDAVIAAFNVTPSSGDRDGRRRATARRQVDRWTCLVSRLFSVHNDAAYQMADAINCGNYDRRPSTYGRRDVQPLNKLWVRLVRSLKFPLDRV